MGGEKVLKEILVERDEKDKMLNSLDQLPAADVMRVKEIRSQGKWESVTLK